MLLKKHKVIRVMSQKINRIKNLLLRKKIQTMIAKNNHLQNLWKINKTRPKKESHNSHPMINPALKMRIPSSGAKNLQKVILSPNKKKVIANQNPQKTNPVLKSLLLVVVIQKITLEAETMKGFQWFIERLRRCRFLLI